MGRNMTEERKLILLTDIIENKVRKEKELQFYEKELNKLQLKLQGIRRDIDINNIIIDLIKTESLIDIREQIKLKSKNI